MNRNDFQTLAGIRLAEATSLLDAGFADGAYYLAGYAVECGLKACIAKSTQRYDFPDVKAVNASHTHDLAFLVRLANLETLRAERARTELSFRDNWDILLQWSKQNRYSRRPIRVATVLVEAVGSVPNGVLR